MEAEMQPILDLLDKSAAQYPAGALAMLATFLLGAVQVYQLPFVQGLISKIPKVGAYLAWDNMTFLGRVVTIFLFSGVGAGITAAVAGGGWAMVLKAALVATIAMGMKQGLKGLQKKSRVKADESASIRVKFPEEVASKR